MDTKDTAEKTAPSVAPAKQAPGRLFCWSPACRLFVPSRCFCVFRLAVGCSLVVAAPPPLWCLAVFVPAAWSPPFFFPLLLCSCLLAWRSLAVLAVRCPPRPLVCFDGLPLLCCPFAFGSSVSPAWPVGCSLAVAAPPPPLCVSLFPSLLPGAPPLFFSSAALPLPSCLVLIGSSWRLLPPPPRPRCFLFSRSSALCALLVLLCFSPGRWLLPCGCCPPSLPSVSRCFCRCRLVLRFFSLLLCSCLPAWRSSAVLAVCSPPPPGVWCLALLCCGLLCAVRCLLGHLSVCCATLMVSAACCAVSLLVPSAWVVCGVVCCFGLRCRVLYCAVCPLVRCCAALLRVAPPGVRLLCVVLFCWARLVPLLVVPCSLALPVALGPCAVRRCVLRCSPALCALCCVCFVVGCLCMLLFAAVLCAVCVLGCRAVRSPSSSLCAVLCCALLVRLRCAVRSVRCAG